MRFSFRLLAVFALFCPRAGAAQLSASEILAKVGQTYQHLQSYEFTGVRSVSNSNGSSDSAITLAVGPQGRIRLTVKDEGGEAILIGDGRSIWNYSPKKKTYSEEPAATPDAKEQAFIGAYQNLLVGRFRGIATMSPAATLEKGEHSMKVGDAKIECYVIKIQSPQGSGELWIDKDRFLVLLSKQTSASAQDGMMSQDTITVTIQRANIDPKFDDNAFQFTPPAKAKRAESSDSQQAQQPVDQKAPVAIRANVSVVLIPVVVRDAQGRVVGDLKKENFQVFDNGKPQEIAGFTIQQRTGENSEASVAAPSLAPASLPASTPVPAVPGGTAKAQTRPDRFIVFVFDDLHLNTADLAQAEQAAKNMLDGSWGDSEMGEVVSTSGSDSGLTQSRDILEKAMTNLKTHTLYRDSGTGCPNIDYYQGDLIVKGDSAALDVAIDETLTCGYNDPEVAKQVAEAAARQAVEVGDHDVRVTLDFIGETVARMATQPGERMMILISPGFQTTTSYGMTLKSKILDEAGQANVTINALDARGLYTSGIKADERIGDLPRSVTIAKTEYHQAATNMSGDVMAELADGTGGTYVHNSNDLQSGFSRLASEPEYVYLLQISAEKVKQDGSYHALAVKVDQKGLKLQSRHGYVAPKQEKRKK